MLSPPKSLTIFAACILTLIVFSPSLAFGQDAAPVDTSDPLAVWALVSGHPASPLALGYALLYVVEIVRRTPRIGAWLFERVLTTDLSRRAAVAVAAIAPGLALVLTEHMSWDVGLRTALLTFAVSQWRFLSAKKSEMPPGAAAINTVGMLLLVVLPLTGCGVSKDKIEKGLNGAVVAIDAGKPCFGVLQRAEEAACVDDAACVEGVRNRWDVVSQGLDAFGCLLCIIDATAEGCATDDPCSRVSL